MRYILWTGGFDSTYLLCKCARESDEPIQPIYIIFDEHIIVDSTDYEIEAQNALLPLIRAKGGIKAEIKDPMRLKESEIPDSKEFDEAYEKCKDDDIISNYLFAMAAKVSQTYPDLMIGIEAPAPGTRDIGRIETSLNGYGLTIDEGAVKCNDDGDKDMYIIWRNLKFPMMRVNAIQELDSFEEWGYSDLPTLTRTCVTRLDYACGICKLCETKMKYGDTFKELMPEGYINHKIKEYLQSTQANYVALFLNFVRNGAVSFGFIQSNGVYSYRSKRTAQKYTDWFNTLLKKYPNLDSVNKSDYGL